MPDQERLLNAINAFEERSYNSDTDGDLSKERAFAIDLYHGRNTNPAPEGRSQVVDRAVAETIDWIKPSLARIFGGENGIVALPPQGPDDEKSSKQEADYLNYQILQKNNWFSIFDTACTDALLTKAGYLYPCFEKRRQVELEKYTNQTDVGLAYIMQDNPQVVSHREFPDPDYKPEPQPVMDHMTGQPAMDPMTGQPMMQIPPPPMLHDIEIRRVKEEKQFKIHVLPPERCKIAHSTDTVQVSRTCNYFEYFDYPTISDLRSEGYDVADDIGGTTDSDDTQEATARDQYYEHTRDDQSPTDPTMRRVKCRWVWVRHDYDDDGIAELQYVVVVGSEILHREEVNRIPIAVLCPKPFPHRHIGTCPADDVGDIQQISTVMLRQGIDNLQLALNPQKFADPTKVNLDDMLVSRPGGITRTRGSAIFGQDFGVYAVPDIFPSAMQGLQYMDHVRQKRTGVNYSFQGLDANALSQLQPGTVNQISSMAAQMAEQIARHFANGIEEMCSIAHELFLKGGHKKDTIKLRGEWVDVDPATWRHRRDFKISVGYSAGNKDAQMARLMAVANLQKEALMGGLPIVKPENVYETCMEITTASDLSQPERFWTDPANIPPPPPPQPDPTVVAMEQIKTQSAEKIKGAEIEAEKEVTGAKLQVDKYKADLQSQTAITLEQMKQQFGGQVEQFKANHQTSIKKLEQGGPDETQVKEVGGRVETLEQQLRETSEALQGALQVLVSAKRQVRRGKNGKAEGVDILAPDGSLIASQKVVRGAAGELLGTE
jgi:hypothetical protein